MAPRHRTDAVIRAFTTIPAIPDGPDAGRDGFVRCSAMRLESDWGTCPHCGGPAVVTWLRTAAERAGMRHRSEVRVGIRCIDGACAGPERAE